MTDFLFHKVSEREKEQIKKQAKSIMDSFSKKLSKVDKKLSLDEGIERPEGERTEGDGSAGDEKFREAIFENAPNKNSDFIIAERKKW